MHQTRRSLLATAGAALTTGAAGCLDLAGGGDAGGTDVQASFYLLYDFARNVAGDDLAVESVVPFGQHGHGWEPSGQVQRDVQRSSLFAYMGPQFQPWADDLVGNLRSDDTDVEIVEAWDGVDFLPLEGTDEEESQDGELPGDPHFWLDPLRVEVAVENLRDGLIAIDDGNTDAYERRTEEYLDEVEGLHAEFEDALSNPVYDTVLVAGHNSFRYLADRYGFEVHALTALSPDEQPSNAAIAEAQSVVEEHDLEYVLAPALESTRAAEQIVAETDAKEVLEITAISGVSDEWRENDWGYLELMENVNRPSFRKALQGEQ